MAQLQNHKGNNRLPTQSPSQTVDCVSVAELARQFTTELIRWRGGMTSEAVVSEAFALARAFKAEEAKDKA